MSYWKKDVDPDITEDNDIWVFDLSNYSRLEEQYYYTVYKKMGDNLLGTDVFGFSLRMTPDRTIRIPKSDFRRLNKVFKEKIVDDPRYTYQVIDRRRQKLALLAKSLCIEETLVGTRKCSRCMPLEIFERLTDFAAFRLEDCFPHELFEEMMLMHLGYTKDAYERLLLTMVTPPIWAHLEYYKMVLELSLRKLKGEVIDLAEFTIRYGLIGKNLLDVTDEESTAKTLDTIIAIFGDCSSVLNEITEVRAYQRQAEAAHIRAKEELLQRSETLPKPCSALVIGLADLLIETMIENEEQCYWRGIVYGYFKHLVDFFRLDLTNVTVDELNSAVQNARVQK